MRGTIMAISIRQKFGLLLALCIITISTTSALAAELIVPDRHQAIQEAIDSAEAGDTVVIRGGEYRENIVLNKPLTVRGDTTSGAVVIIAAITSEPVITVTGVTAVTIAGITVSGSAIAGFYIVDSSAVKLLNTTATGNRYGIHLERSNGNTIQESRAERNEYGIYLTRSSDNAIEGNRADNNNDKGIILFDSSRNSLTGNSATANLWDGINLYNSHRNSIRGNKLWKNTFPMVIISSDDNELADNSKMRRLYLILPVLLIYFGIVIYLVERKLFYLFLSGPKRQKSKQMGNFGGG
ncbi:MAG: hypothetical protein GY721_02395 [Deltaproteobacteria bacterium]|nr:hypothetical protein [Deltaproteobacteria bacterium]